MKKKTKDKLIKTYAVQLRASQLKKIKKFMKYKKINKISPSLRFLIDMGLENC